MFMENGAIWLPLIGAALHPFLGACIQAAGRRGVRLTVTVAVANLVTSAVFFAVLSPGGGWTLSEGDFWAIGNGVFFFLGQWFSIQSVKSGDLAVHSSALGLKVVVVGVFSMWVGLEASSWNLVTGVALASLAVFLVSGGSFEGWRKHRVTVWLTLAACLFFGLNDFLTGWRSPQVGADRWLTLMMATSGLISCLLLVGRRREALDALVSSGGFRLVLLAGLLLALQALAVNLAFSRYQQPTLSNVVYSSRGVMAVFFLYLAQKKGCRRLDREQLLGASLMIVALAVVLVG